MTPSRILGSARTAWHALRSLMKRHKFVSAVVILLVLYGGYQVYAAATAPSTATRYVTTTVATGTVVATMTETGQVSASQQLSLAPKASGTVTAVYVQPGQHVSAGQVIAQLDATDAVQSLESAKLSLANEELSYGQTTATSTLALNLLSAENGVTNASTSLQKSHDASYASLTSVYTDFSNVLNDLDSALYDQNVPGRSTQDNIDAFADSVSQYDDSVNIYKTSAATSYTAAVAAYDTALAAYKAVPLTATDDQLVTLAGQTYTAAQAIAEAVKNTHDLFDRVNSDYTLYNLKSSTVLTSLLSSTATDATTVNNDLSTTLTVKSNIVTAEQTLAEAENTLAQTEGGANALTVQQAALALQQAEDAVTNAEQTVADYTVTAPFSGTVASVGVKRYDQASSGTTVATLVANEQTVDISVNEVDAAKLSVGQKATLTFDALPNVTVAGTVASVDTLGTASAGVVSYDAVITFDTPNSQVLPGMSATADIVTGTATGLVIPSSAVKTSGSQSYVELFSPPLAGASAPTGAPSPTPPARVPVVTGLSDDTNVIVTSGLSPGDQVVTQTVAGASAPTTSSGPSLFGGNRTGGAVRVGGGNAVFRGPGG